MWTRVVLVVVALLLAALVLAGVGVGTGMVRVGPRGIAFGRAEEAPESDQAKPIVVSANELLRQAAHNTPAASEAQTGNDAPAANSTPAANRTRAVNSAAIANVPRPKADAASKQDANSKAGTSVASKVSDDAKRVIATNANSAAAKAAQDQKQPSLPKNAPWAAGMPAVRVDAGSVAAARGPGGDEWEADRGFDGGQIVDRGPIPIANTDFPELYRTEHYVMTAWHKDLPNGRYRVSLYFAETCPYITAAGQRVFHFSVQDQQVRDFDVFREAGGRQRALVRTFHVAVTDGKLRILFHQTDKNAPEINGIEVVEEGK